MDHQPTVWEGLSQEHPKSSYNMTLGQHTCSHVHVFIIGGVLTTNICSYNVNILKYSTKKASL